MISVIIPAHNAADTITACVQALQQQSGVTEPYEILVVDDGSSDATAAKAAAAGATVIHQPNKGPAAARNAGIQAAGGDLICFTDADCLARPDWLAAITRPLRQDPEIDGVKGVYSTRQKGLTARFVQLEYEDKYDRLLNYEQINFMDSNSAACRRQALLNVGGFDETFKTAAVEDRELSYRLATQGYKMVFQPRAIVEHTHANSLLDYGRKKFFNGYWSAWIIRQFPEMLIEDTYTPHEQKLQIMLMGGVVAMIPVALIFPLFWLLLFLLLLAFKLTTLPFVSKAWRRDRFIALTAPLMLALRAFALGVGYLCGLLKINAPQQLK